MIELRIDPEFEGKIPPLTQAEFDQLRENILEAGEVYEPIVVWNGVIVDGHNRWKVIRENPEITWKTREIQFPDKWAAFGWMYKNQLGRRNLTEAQRYYLIGKRDEAEKRSLGSNQHTSEEGFQNGNPRGGTAERIAKEYGIGAGTVVRAEKYAKGLDAIREINPETAESILSGKLTPSKADVTVVGVAEKEIRPNLVRKIEAGKKVASVEIPDLYGIKVNGQYNGGGTSEYRENRQKIAEYVAGLYSTDDEVEYTVEDLLAEIESNAESFLCILRNMMNDHDALVKENAETVTAFITEKIINEIKKIERCVEE